MFNHGLTTAVFEHEIELISEEYPRTLRVVGRDDLQGTNARKTHPVFRLNILRMTTAIEPVDTAIEPGGFASPEE